MKSNIIRFLIGIVLASIVAEFIHKNFAMPIIAMFIEPKYGSAKN